MQNRGTLNGTQTAITSGTFQQQWGLDATGNWKTFKQDNDGNGTWELNQTCTTNKVNEITNVTNSAGAAWATPSYDEAGNMVGIPNPPATTTGSTPAWNPFTESQWNNFTVAQWNAFTLDSGTVPTQLSARYDAWNRLVEIQNGTTRLVENVYDARGYRIRKDTFVTGTLSESRHYYYTPGWQCVEERLDSSATAERQFVWGLRYIDDLILRDRSTANNGTMNERLYGMQDGNWNMIAICDTTGSVTERYAYSAYGAPVFMTGAGTVQTSSAIGFETLYAGYRWDGNSPQMYYVRNRFLLSLIGTWNRRDPLGYQEDLMNLQESVASRPIVMVDPFGLQFRMPRSPRSTWQPRPGRSSPIRRDPRPTVRPVRKPIRNPPDPRTGNPWGPSSPFPTIGEPRNPTSAPSNGPSISTGDPDPSSCTQQVLTWPQQILQNLPNPSGSRDCKKAFGFLECPSGDASMYGTLTTFVKNLLQQIGAPPGVQVELGNCAIVDPAGFPVNGRGRLRFVCACNQSECRNGYED